MKFINVVEKFKKTINERAENFSHQYVIFGIFASLNFPVYWVIWHYYSLQSYENLPLRIIATCLCLPLIFTRYWPPSVKSWLPLYWWFTLTFCLPFFFTFMLLENGFSAVWLMSTTAIMFWLILLVDTISFFVILTVGFVAGLCLFLMLGGSIPLVEYQGYISQYVGTLFVGLLFARNKEISERAKLQAMRSVSTTIAHELRTPLASLQSSINGLERYYPKLVGAYKLAKEKNLEVEVIRPAHFQLLEKLFEDSKVEIRYSHMVINSLLSNSNQINLTQGLERYIHSITECLEQALQRYPFSNDKQRSAVHYQRGEDFDFHGEELLLIHVIFNLLKNALYFIEKAGKGEISIWLEKGGKFNNLHFKDTGIGIASENLKKLFTRFYSTERHGSGLGLAFCKMVMRGFGGDIVCTSEAGVYTEFTLIFPVVKK